MHLLVALDEPHHLLGRVGEVLRGLRQVQQAPERRGVEVLRRGPQHPELQAVLHLVEPVLEVVDLGGQAGVAEDQRRVGEADRRLGDVLHLDQHVDGPVEIGEGAVLRWLGRLPRRRGGQLAEPVDARRRPLEEEDVAGQDDLVAVDVDDPLPLPADRHDPHAGRHRQLERAEGAVRHVAVLTHPHPVRHLLGPGQVGDQLTRDAEAVGDDASDVDRVVGDALDGPDHLQHRRHGVGLSRRAHREDADRAHVVHQHGHLLLEVADLLGHVRIAEVQRRVGQVDHELGGVLGLREHGLEVPGSVVHLRSLQSVVSRFPPRPRP